MKYVPNTRCGKADADPSVVRHNRLINSGPIIPSRSECAPLAPKGHDHEVELLQVQVYPYDRPQ